MSRTPGVIKRQGHGHLARSGKRARCPRSHRRTSPAFHHTPRTAGFSLLELLVVIAIIGIVASFAIPSVSGIVGGSKLTQATDMVVGQIKFAGQVALSQNRPVEVRFYKYQDPSIPGSTNAIRAMQLLVLNPDSTRNPVTRPQKFPSPIIISDNPTVTQLGAELQSSALGSGEKAAALPAGYTYYTFQFRPDGSTTLSSGTIFLTVQDGNRPGNPPANFATVQIEPVTGGIRLYRP